MEDAKKKREVKAISDVMGDLAGAIDGTPSMIEEVDGNTPFAHASKQLQVAHDEDGFPNAGPKRIT